MDLDVWDCFGRKKTLVLKLKKYGNNVIICSQTSMSVVVGQISVVLDSVEISRVATAVSVPQDIKQVKMDGHV